MRQARHVVDGLDGDSRHGGAYYTIGLDPMTLPDTARSRARPSRPSASARAAARTSSRAALPNLAVRPTSRRHRARPRTRGTPWEDRGRIGFVAALVETTQQVLTSPPRFFASMPVTGGIGRPCSTAILVGYVGLVVAALYNCSLPAVVGSTFAGWTAAPSCGASCRCCRAASASSSQLIFAPVIVILGLFIVPGIVHLVLLLLGGRGSGFEATFRVVCYSEAAARRQHRPALRRRHRGPCTTMVLAIIGLSAAHGISRGTAAAAVLLPLVLLCCCCAGARPSSSAAWPRC